MTTSLPSVSPRSISLPIARSCAVAYYIGQQWHPSAAPVDLFNLLVPLPSIDRTAIHPVEGTVSRQTLESNGVNAPRDLVKGQRVMHSCAQKPQTIDGMRHIRHNA